MDQLNEEIDILKHLSNQRVSAFIAKLILRKHQRALVHSFRKYMMDDMTRDDEKDQTTTTSVLSQNDDELINRSSSALISDE